MSMTISPYVCPARDTAGNLPIAYMMNVMAKAAEGAPVQHQSRRDGPMPHAWERTMYPIWDWYACSYRIDPATRPMSDVQVGDYLVALGSMSGYNLYPNDVVRVVDHKTLGQDVPIGQEYEPKDKRISDLGLSVWAAGYFRYATDDEICAHRSVLVSITRVASTPIFKVGDYATSTSEWGGLHPGGVYLVKHVDEFGSISIHLPTSEPGTLTLFNHLHFEAATPDAIRNHLLHEAACRGFIVGNLMYDNLKITGVYAWVPGATENPSASSLSCTKRMALGKPFVIVRYDPHWLVALDDLDDVTPYAPRATKRVPMRSKDYPPVFWVRTKGCLIASLITHMSPNGALSTSSDVTNQAIYSPEWVMTHLEWSTDRADWRPCFREVNA